MTKPDLNLLVTLDVLLSENSVAAAARRLRLSPSAMSRALARLRKTLGDPLLVRAGRNLVPTPRALAIRDEAGRLAQDCRALLRPAEKIELASLRRSFTIRSGDGFVDNFAPALVARARREAPGICLRFVAKSDNDPAALRQGRADFETGVIGETTRPELRRLILFRDRFIGIARRDHKLARTAMTAEHFAAGAHVAVVHRDSDQAPVDAALAAKGLSRTIATVVGGFAAAVALVRADKLIAVVPERHTENLRQGLWSFDLPVTVPDFAVSLMWHPRMDNDAAHRWLRETIRSVCGKKR